MRGGCAAAGPVSTLRPMTPADLLAALPTLSLAHRRYRYPDFLDSEEADWQSFSAAAAELAAGRDEHGLGRLVAFYATGTALDVYFAWRDDRITERKPVKRRRR